MTSAARPLRSSVCEGLVSHARRARPAHSFRYRVFMTLLDLDELPALSSRLHLFGHNRRRLVGFHDADHFSASAGGVREDLERTLQAEGVEMPRGRVEVLAHCRIAGHVFNPVSFHYCYRPDETVAVVVAEVNNTFGDRHSYVLPVEGGRFEWRTKKLMHVSPFFQPDAGTYRWTLPPPGERVEAGVDLTRDGATVLSARLSLARRPLGDRALASALARHPFMTLTVMGAIHFEALRLFLKRAPFWSRPAYDPGLARGGPA